MSKPVGTPGIGATALTAIAWALLKNIIKDEKKTTFSNDVKDSANKVVKSKVLAKLSEMKESDREELKQVLDPENPDRGRVTELMRKYNIVRPSATGKKRTAEDANIADQGVAQAPTEGEKQQEPAQALVAQAPAVPAVDAPKERKKPAKRPTITQKLEELTMKVAETAEQSRMRNISLAEDIGQVGAGVQEIKDAIKMIQADPKLKKIERKIRSRLSANGVNNFEGVGGIDRSDIRQIIETIPTEYRGILGPAVQGLLGDELNLNQVVAGLVGVGVSISSGSLTAGSVASSAIPRILDAFQVDLTDMVTSLAPQAPAPTTQAPAIAGPARQPDVGNIINVATAGIDAVPAQAQTPPGILSQFIQLYDLTRTGVRQGIENSGARQPTEDEIRRGVIAGGMATAISAGLSSGSAMTAASSGAVGGLVGGVASGLTAGNMQRLSTAIEGRLSAGGIEITPERREQIRRVTQLIPPTTIGAYLGYNPTNTEPMGKGIVYGGGVTESKLAVPQSVIDNTLMQLDQEGSNNKVWQPKSIVPTTDILDESKEERYADDIEFVAFNYIAPTSEGGYGTVDTNPLKASQARADSIRYDDSGVYIPYLLWNSDNFNENNMVDKKRLEKLALGPQLPEMVFYEQDNADTFAEETEYQFANGENTAIGFLSPYADFSNVDNWWSMNETSELYTINP
jgi:hypothetical protein